MAFEIGHFRNFWTPMTLDKVTRHTSRNTHGIYHSLTSINIHIPNFSKIGKNVDTQMDRRWDWLYYKDSEELT